MKSKKLDLSPLFIAINNLPRDDGNLPDGLDLTNADQVAAILASPEIETALKALVDDETKGLKNNWDKVKRQNIRLQEQARKALDKSGDEDGNAIAQAVLDYFQDETEQSMIENNQFDRVIEARESRLNSSWQKKLDAANKKSGELESSVTDLQNDINDGVITRALQDVLAGHKPHNLAQSTALLKSMGVVKLDADGTPLPFKGDEQLLNDKNEIIDLKGYVEQYVADNAYQFSSPRGSGSGNGSGGGGSQKRSDMTRPEKVAFIGEHGQEAYGQLPD